MKAPQFITIWAKWGLIPRLMAAVGFASLVGGGIQNTSRARSRGRTFGPPRA